MRRGDYSQKNGTYSEKGPYKGNDTHEKMTQIMIIKKLNFNEASTLRVRQKRNKKV